MAGSLKYTEGQKIISKGRLHLAHSLLRSQMPLPHFCCLLRESEEERPARIGVVHGNYKHPSLSRSPPSQHVSHPSFISSAVPCGWFFFAHHISFCLPILQSLYTFHTAAQS